MKTKDNLLQERRFGGPARVHALRHAEDWRGGHSERPGRPEIRDHRAAGHAGHADRPGGYGRRGGRAGPEEQFDGGHRRHGGRGGPEDRPDGERSGRGPGGRGGGPGGHGGHGGRGPGGRGGRGGPRVGRGDVRAATLALLAEQPLHGYEIIQQITERSGGGWRPSPGSVYPALQLLEDQGLVQSDQAEGRRVYHLTDAGRVYVQQHQAEFAAAWVAVTDTVDEGARELRGLLDQVGTALSQVVQVGTVAQVAEAKELLIATRRRLYGILAEGDAAGDTDRA
jgi:DNA-binding PadR family transcriptional regulator